MQSSTICQLSLKKGRGEPWNLQGMLQLPTEDPDLEGKAVKLNFQRKVVLPLPKDSKWSKDKLNFSRVNQIICWKHWRAARSQTGFFSVSHSSLSSLHPQVDFVLVTNSDKIRHGRVIDCPDLIFLVNNLQPQFLWLKRITPKKVFFCEIC